MVAERVRLPLHTRCVKFAHGKEVAVTATVDNNEDILDSRDVIARMEELETNLDPDQVIEDGLDDEEIYDLTNELRILQALDDEGNSATSDWKYGATLIRDSYFKDYAQELAEEIGALPPDHAWPTSYIDWDSATRDLQMDYTSVEFDGVTYWVR